ncbi:hypothetical protein DMENIID0001_041310 [Sergentomyia squamirostris]
MSVNKMNICWNTHRDSLGAAFPQMLIDRKFVDVTLVCERRRIHCHRVVLAACSSFFAEILEENPTQHPIIILPGEIKFWAIQALVDFMYKGEVSVLETGFEQLVKCAELLQIHSLNAVSGESNLREDHLIRVKGEVPDVPEIIHPMQEELSLQLHHELSAKEPRRYCQKSTSKISCSSKMIHQWNQNEFRDLVENPPMVSGLKTESFPDYDDGTSSITGKDIPPVPNSSSNIKTQMGSKKSRMLPKPPKNFALKPSQGNLRSYDAKAMWSAMMSVKGGMSANRASKMYKVPRLSLHSYMKRYGIKSYFPQSAALKKYHLAKNSNK